LPLQKRRLSALPFAPLRFAMFRVPRSGFRVLIPTPKLRNSETPKRDSLLEHLVPLLIAKNVRLIRDQNRSHGIEFERESPFSRKLTEFQSG